MSKPTLLNARILTALVGATLVAVAGTAAAVSLPISFGHKASTPVGAVDARMDGANAATCIAPSLPALPALPAVPAVPLPVPLPIVLPALPALPQPSAAAAVCAEAGLDGVHANATADAMGLVEAGTEADVDTSEQAEAAEGAAGCLKGFLQGLADKIGGWF